MATIRLIFASTARDGISFSDLIDIRRVAVPFNRANGISGVLLFVGTHFLQSLEGERALVNQLYNKIVLDPRHRDVMIIDYANISRRDVVSWSMKLVRLDGDQTARRREILEKHAGSAAADVSQLTGKCARALLKELGRFESNVEVGAAAAGAYQGF